jgi:tetratricopeptide (TPR) repeat protein
MKKVIISLVFAALFASCSSTDEKKVGKKSVSDKDFDLKTRFNYDTKDEKVPVDKLENIKDALVLESLDRLSLKNLYKLDLDENPLIQGSAFCHMGKKGNAMNKFNEHYKKLKGNPIYWNAIGTCLLINKDYREAKLYFETSLHFYRKATRSNKLYAPAMNNIGVLFATRGDDERAMNTFRQVLKEYPNSKTASFNLGQIYLKYGIYTRALKYFEYLYSIEPEDVDVLGGLGMGNLLKKNIDKAVNYYQKIPKPQLEKAYLGLPYAFVTQLKGDLKGALAIFKEVEKPPKGDFRHFYYEVKKYLDAEVEKEKALKKAKEEAKKKAAQAKKQAEKEAKAKAKEAKAKEEAKKKTEEKK